VIKCFLSYPIGLSPLIKLRIVLKDNDKQVGKYYTYK